MSGNDSDPLVEQKTHLLAQIDQAFDGVVLGDGVSLHETVVIDNYGGPSERRAARAPDEKLDWRRLVDDPELVKTCGVGGPSFYDAVGFRFHLPAYLSLAVRDYDREDADHVIGSLLYILGVACDSDERLAILGPTQRRCVRDVLTFIQDTYEPDAYELRQAIDGYWNCDR